MSLATALANYNDFNRGSRINEYYTKLYGGTDYDHAVAGLFGKLPQSLTHGEHMNDVGKTVTHPTFSNESFYHSKETPGGQWGTIKGEEVFIPSKANIQSMGEAGLAKFFADHEQGVNLVTPAQYLVQDKALKEYK